MRTRSSVLAAVTRIADDCHAREVTPLVFGRVRREATRDSPGHAHEDGLGQPARVDLHRRQGARRQDHKLGSRSGSAERAVTTWTPQGRLSRWHSVGRHWIPREERNPDDQWPDCHAARWPRVLCRLGRAPAEPRRESACFASCRSLRPRERRAHDGQNAGVPTFLRPPYMLGTLLSLGTLQRSRHRERCIALRQAKVAGISRCRGMRLLIAAAP